MLGLGNNHTLDFGGTGMESTLKAIHAAGIVSSGAGQSPFAPAILEIRGKRIALFSVFCSNDKLPGLATTADPEAIISAIESARESADLIIVLPHWGNENSRQVTAQQRAQARSWLLHGADVVIGSGPHVVQETEFSPRGYVAYSLGNAVFDGVERLHEWQRGGALELWLDESSAKPIRAIFHELTLTKGLPTVKP